MSLPDDNGVTLKYCPGCLGFRRCWCEKGWRCCVDGDGRWCWVTPSIEAGCNGSGYSIAICCCCFPPPFAVVVDKSGGELSVSVVWVSAADVACDVMTMLWLLLLLLFTGV